ncbi:CDP-diacylglycerol--serine O-phosphatidyltransferase [Chlorobium sp.]|jgi:CDP-diacylglycerol--serine O-phosphatidyltransferase|uniref:CDP-diacylglycerol--serine O-phosphatidyltransferase n=1 Tax=Chlorobium sp. TaxID=1095 RepID=UPI003C5319F1|nr:CDP-diacylglycerol--serine O-phosphatidyltransferase [Chlorobiaceae bacterium]NTW93496.1 CDP-diacylglycerol--serine O-phosphatidyltransferase [Chlorobiaceae bacterium]
MADAEKQTSRKRYPPVLRSDPEGRSRLLPFVSRSFVPSVFTVMNMVCGYIAIVMSGEGSFTAACWFIIFAAFFDTIDGFVARVTNGTSDFGIELDSLSDLVSFGAAPAYLVYRFALEGMDGYTGIFLSSLVMVGSGLRLARFNINLIGYRKESFSGLPSPAQALTVAGFVLWMGSERMLPAQSLQSVLGWLSVILSILMVSKVNYDALPKPTVETFRKQPVQLSLYLIAIFCVLLFQAKAFFLAMLLYILLGVIRSLGLFIRQWQT